jgi:hypothetical protein
MIAKKINKMLIIVTAMSLICAGQAFSQENTAAVLVQLSPLNGGEVNPGLGLHTIAQNSEMALSAVAKPGYQFMYWIGDVAEPTSQKTIALVNTPKIIIAVFERVEYDFLDRNVEIKSAPMGGLSASGRPPRSGGLDTPSFGRPPADRPDMPRPPKDDGDVPVPSTPEPTTVVLLSLGALILRRNTAKD